MGQGLPCTNFSTYIYRHGFAFYGSCLNRFDFFCAPELTENFPNSKFLWSMVNSQFLHIFLSSNFVKSNLNSSFLKDFLVSHSRNLGFSIIFCLTPNFLRISLSPNFLRILLTRVTDTPCCSNDAKVFSVKTEFYSSLEAFLWLLLPSQPPHKG